MTWDTREPRKQAKPSASAPTGWDGPGWWGEAGQPGPSPRRRCDRLRLRGPGGIQDGPASTRSAGGSGAGSAAGRPSPSPTASRRQAGCVAGLGPSRVRATASISARLVVGFGLGMFGALFLAAVGVSALSQSYDGRILPGVHAGSVDVSGLTRDEAIAKIDTAYASSEPGQGHDHDPGRHADDHLRAGRIAWPIPRPWRMRPWR